MADPFGGFPRDSPGEVARPCPASGTRPRPALTWLKLVRTLVAVDGVEGVAEVVQQGVGSGDDAGGGLDLDGVVAACGADEFPDGRWCLSSPCQAPRSSRKA